MKRGSPWIHKFTALQQCKARGVRPAVFEREGGLYTLELPFTTDWAAAARANPGTRNILCGVTGVTLWPDISAANDRGRPAA